MGPRSSVSAAVMPSMDGIRKLLLPKMTRQISETPSPTSAGVWSLPARHCSTMTTRNSAVIEKSMPVVSKGMMLPSSVPVTLPATQ